MADKAISVRLDAPAQRALGVLMGDGTSQSEAIRSALINSARASRLERMEADSKRLAADAGDRALVSELQEFFGEL